MTLERATPWLVGVLVGIFLLQAILSTWDDSPTFDETVNPSIGYAELFVRDLSFYHDHPPLNRVLTAIPLLALRPAIPFDHFRWQKKVHRLKERYDYAHQFFYVANKNAQQMLFWSRLPIIFLSLILGLLVFNWARTLYGDYSGLFALFLFAFEPNIIAHSRLTTNDLLITLFVFATVYQFWCYFRSPSLKSLILTGMLFGFALISKFSAIMLFPMIFVLTFFGPRSLNYGGARPEFPLKGMEAIFEKIVVAAKIMGVVAAIAIAVILVFYGSQWKIFLNGLVDTMAHYERGHSAFLLGNHSRDGWWYYFPVVFLLKTPIPLLVCLLLTVIFSSFRKIRFEAFLWIPMGVIIGTALPSHINLGIRHILPLFPFLIVFCSSIVTIKFRKPRVFGSCLAGLALWYIVSTLSIFPSYLAYFNEFVGPQKGYHYLVDSNLDWGQDLKRLKMFMDKHGIRHIYLSYFGTADPCHYGIEYLDLPAPPTWCKARKDNFKADFLAISATNLQGVYLPDKRSYDWLRSYKPVAQIGYSILVYNIRGDAVAHNELVKLYIRYGKFEEALREAKILVRIAPKEPVAQASLGAAYFRLSLFEEARSAFKTALEMDPRNEVARTGMKALENVSTKRIQKL